MPLSKTILGFLRDGTCNQCGDCCREETLPARKEAYEKAGIPFEVINLDCKCFDQATGRCKDYENRPIECKLFPVHPADIAALANCSYKFPHPHEIPFIIFNNETVSKAPPLGKTVKCPKCQKECAVQTNDASSNRFHFINCCGSVYLVGIDGKDISRINPDKSGFMGTQP